MSTFESYRYTSHDRSTCLLSDGAGESFLLGKELPSDCHFRRKQIESGFSPVVLSAENERLNLSESEVRHSVEH